MTDLAKKLFQIVDAILDGVVYAEELQRFTGLPLEECEKILDDYWKIRKSFDDYL